MAIADVGQRTDSAGRSLSLLLLRLLVAFIFIWHGLPKALDPAAAAEKFVGFGLPGWLGFPTGVVEVVAGLLLATGFFFTTAVVLLTVIIVGALVTVQIPGGFTAGLERDLMILAALIVLAASGPGKPALGRRERAVARSTTAVEGTA